MALYTLDPERSTLHGHFSRDLPPVLTIDPGDTVRYHTLDADWWEDTPEPRKKFEPRSEELDKGHAMNGPVYIRGAKPGMALEVQIGEIIPSSWGWTWAGVFMGDVGKRILGENEELHIAWRLDAETMTGTTPDGRQVALRPFMGVMGMPPDEPGIHSTQPPRYCGGNLDCKELVEGTTLYLPIPVEGGLFSVGDGHGAQGDGEISMTAIECPIARLDLTFNLRDAMKLTTPRARTADSWISFGFHEDLDEAVLIACADMVEIIVAQYGVSRTEALALASVVADVRVTQIVNRVKGAHVVLKDGAIR
jgi:acetamidase/formamidase